MPPTYSTPSSLLGNQLPSFALPGVDGKTHRSEDFAGAKAVVVVFMCNHCPYVKATRGRVNALAKAYQAKGVQLVAISSNDPADYPEDGFEEMKKVSQEMGFVFPYLFDETQEVAKAFSAVCTPEFYAYGMKNNQWTLKYHGRLDDSWKDEAAVTQRDLAQALDDILAGREPGSDQKAAIGCSIKWKK